MRKNTYTLLITLFCINLNADTHYINSGNYYYQPDSLTINVYDTVIWLNDQGYHNVNFDISSTTGNSFGNPFSFSSSPTFSDTIHTHVFSVSGFYQYDCSVGTHAIQGMIGSINVNAVSFIDCNGITNGTSLLDTCGVCQQAYKYNFITHVPTYINDTFNVVLGPNEILVMPNDPSNPLWNSSCDSSVYDIISNSADHSILEIAIDTCGLASTLDGPGPFTVFAPTDAAFNALPAGTISSLLSNLPALTDILKHHVVSGSVMSSMLSNGQTFTTLEGSDVTVTMSGGSVYIENAMVTVADIVGDNGVVHVIDAVLTPPSPANINELKSDDKIIYTVDILGKIVVGQEKKNMILFDIYKSGKTIRRLVIN